MKRIGKAWCLLLALSVLLGVPSGCGAKKKQESAPAEENGPVVIEALNIAFAPSDASETIMAATEPLSATVFSALWLGTSFHAADLIGFAAIISTIFLLAKSE